MKKSIITISREFGSGGRCIGEELSRKLGIDYYDAAIILKTAEKTGLDPKFIAEKGEYASRKSFLAYAFASRTPDGVSLEDYLQQVQRKVILEAAEKGPCVIIGRCADYILKNREDVLNVFIHGNPAEKSKRIMELYGKSEREAEEMMRDVDKKRAVNYKYYTDQQWGQAQNYMIALNSSEIGYEGCMDIIQSLYEKE